MLQSLFDCNSIHYLPRLLAAAAGLTCKKAIRSPEGERIAVWIFQLKLKASESQTSLRFSLFTIPFTSIIQ